MPETLNPALLAFRPRQVVLLANQNQNQNQNINMTNKTTLNSEQKTLLLHSVARFLGRNGFSKTLKKFRSESHVQTDTLKDSLLDLEELYIKYIEMCDDAKTNFKGQKEQEKQVRTEEEKKLEPQPEEPGKYKDKKKKKNKLISESESKPSTAEEKTADLSLERENFTGSETHKKNTKDKEKKKKSLADDSLIDNVDSRAVSSTAMDTNDSPVEETSSKSKIKKKKEDVLKDITVSGSAGDDSKMSDMDATEDNKGSKKRKRLGSDENNLKPADTITTEESKHRKIEGLVENGNLDKSAEKSSIQKSMKKHHNDSAEPKTANAFQRVKVDEVVFTDERLKDNSYWAKGGAETGYGAKAQEVLGQVRGRDFRHEKTKKKRGSYRGGQIDLQSHSIKFNYSDDE